MISAFHRLPLASPEHRFVLQGFPDARCNDGWFQVSWTPNWTGVSGDDAKRVRRRLRGRWMRIEVANGSGGAIFRRISFCSCAEVADADGRSAVAVRLSWDDRLELLEDATLSREGAEEPLSLRICSPRWWDWLVILRRIPRGNAEGALLALGGLLLGVIGIAAAVRGTGPSAISPPTVAAQPALRAVDTVAERPPVAAKPGQQALQRWSLLDGDTATDLVIRSTRQSPGSSGISIECDAAPSEHLVFRSTVIPAVGSWSLRIDDGESKPRWLPGAGEISVRVLGSRHYRFLIYSDDVGASASIRNVEIKHASDAERCIELAWPQSGPVAEAETAENLANWRAYFGLRDSESDEACAARVASWVHSRSRVVDLKSPRWWKFGSACVPASDAAISIDGDCGVFATVLLQALSQVDIQARVVCLGSKRFERGEQLGDTHALVEVFDRRSMRWVLVDPTFNVQVVDGEGKSLGIAELMATQLRGGKWALRSIAPSLPGRSASEYYLPFGDLLWVADAPAREELGAYGAGYRSRDQTVAEITRAKYSGAK